MFTQLDNGGPAQPHHDVYSVILNFDKYLVLDSTWLRDEYMQHSALTSAI